MLGIHRSAIGHRSIVRLFGSIMVAALSIGCASHASRMGPVRDLLRQGRTSVALEELDKRFGDKSEDLVYLMERGLLLRYAGQLDQSNEVFEQAENLADDLYTKSISRSLAALITSDTTLPYEGEDFERVVINYYRAMNYLDLTQTEDALVECRKVISKLRQYREKYEGESPKKYKTDPFIHYLTGLLYLRVHEINDAYISFKKANAAFDEESTELGVSRPAMLGDDLLTAATQLGFTSDIIEIEKAYPRCRVREQLSPGQGELFVFVEVGFIPMKTEVALTVPILESEKDDDDAVELTHRLRGRAVMRRTWDDVHYWLRIALPSYPPPLPPFWATVDVGGTQATFMQNLDVLARSSLSDRMPNILLRALVRAVAKYLASTKGEDAVEEKHGETAGAVVGGLLNLMAAATERADLRSWLGLPREIYVARLRLPGGPAPLEITLKDRSGRSLDRGVMNVTVAAGETNFVAFRFFE